MKHTVFTGAATALITPLTQSGIDFEAFGRLIDWQIEQGIDALVIAGTTGEGSTLTDEEHREAIRFSVEREGDRVYLSFLSDDPDKPPTHGPHNYDRDALLHKVIVPAVSPDQDLLIDSQGEYSTIMNIFLAYTGKVRSMSVAGKDAESYTCVESRGGPLQVGDSIPRRS